jgi:uncharacterized protein (DUF2062 family)
MKRLIATLTGSIAGLSAESAALVLALGVTLGVFPIYGLPTLLCALASLILGVNLPAVQLVNQLVTPLQLAMLVPFVRLGARLVGSPHSANWAAGLGVSALQAVAGWLSIGVPLGMLLYFALVWIFRMSISRRSSRQYLPLAQAG